MKKFDDIEDAEVIEPEAVEPEEIDETELAAESRRKPKQCIQPCFREECLSQRAIWIAKYPYSKSISDFICRTRKGADGALLL